MKPRHLFTAFSLTLAAQMLASAILPTTADALSFKPPNRGAPQATAGGATRSTCMQGTQPLTILAPSSNVGLTTQAYPTFFVYVPATKATTAEFVLKDLDASRKDNDVYRAQLPLSGKAGIISITLPKSEKELTAGKDYRWFFSVICNPEERINDVFVGAWIQRVLPETNSPLASADKAALLKQPAIYAEAGIWHDTLASLAKLRSKNPADATLKQDWVELLKSAGLDQLVEQPVVVQELAAVDSQR